MTTVSYLTVQKIIMDGRTCYVFHSLVSTPPICEYDGPLINPPIEVMDALDEATHFISDNSIAVWSGLSPQGHPDAHDTNSVPWEFYHRSYAL